MAYWFASQYVFLRVMNGSSGAGWTCPRASVARDATVCSPGAGFFQSNVHQVQANGVSLWGVSLAGVHGPSSILTSTVRSGVPSLQAAPVSRMLPPSAFTARATTDFRLI